MQISFKKLARGFPAWLFSLPLKLGHGLQGLFLACVWGETRYTFPKPYGAKVFVFHQLSKVNAVLVHKPLFAAPEEIPAQFQDLKQWKPHKGKVPVLCPVELAKTRMLHAEHALEQEEISRAKVQQVLLEKCAEHQLSATDVAFSLHPSLVYAMKGVKKDKPVKLLPFGTVSKAKEAKEDVKNKAVMIKAFGADWVISPFKGMSEFNAEKAGPFFWVKAVQEAESGNMKFSEMNVSGVRIPYLTNTRAVIHEPLLVFEEPAPPTKKARKR